MKYKTPNDYNKEISLKKDKTLGYLYFIDKEHPLSCNGVGKVYHHRHVISLKIGKWIDKSYHVHHKNEDKEDNNFENLNIISPNMHTRIHNKSRVIVKSCEDCSKKFKSNKPSSRFCSTKCKNSFLYNERLENKVDKLLLERLVRLMPTTKIAQLYGKSDVAAGKLCKKYGIEKPSRGYWAKRKSNSPVA